MATIIESESPPSPTNNESDGEADQDDFEEEKYDIKPKNTGNGFADILKRLESAGALLKKPKKEYRCKTCDEDFVDWEDLENHLYQHVSLPSVVLERLPSDYEDTVASEDENWSDDEELQLPLKREAHKTPQKVDISQILKKTGLTIKKSETGKSSDAALNKLSNLGFTIKKSSTPIKKEKIEERNETRDSERNKKVGNIKLKLKSDGNNINTFKVINGLKEFRTSDDDDEESEHEGGNDEEFGENKSKNKNQDDDEEDFEADSDEEQHLNDSRRSSENSESGKNDLLNQMKKFQGKQIKIEPIRIQKSGSLTIVKQLPAKISIKSDASIEQNKEILKRETPIAKSLGRPSVKQTPKRGPNNPLPIKNQESQQTSDSPSPTKEVHKTPERRESQEVNTENVAVKQEVHDSTETESKNVPFVSQEIKSERSSPPLDRAPTPIIAKIKTEPSVSNATTTANSFLPVTKTEDSNVTIIEINGDSNDEDDDCCVVSSTPAPDVKPIIPKTEVATPLPPPSYSTALPYPASSQPSSYTTAPVLSSRLSSTPSLEKQHNFNWNAPDSKPPIDMLEKSADDIFESLLSSSTKKENMSSLSDVSEYISLDTLGPKHTCEVCNTRFTDISLFEEHKRMTGHSNSLVAPSSSTLLPYNPASNLLSSLLPVKLAEQVGKLSTIGNSGPGFTHQQNVMINIQAYPGAGGVMQPPPQPYNSYGPQGHNQQGGYAQAPNNMYTSSPGQSMPGQYPGSTYPQSPGYGQYPTPMSTPGYPGTMPTNVYSSASSPYSTASPLQSMQQAVYGQSATGMMNQQPATMMAPPGSSPSQVYSSASSPNAMKQSSNIRIQNVQTFPPGHLGQTINSGQTATSGQQVGSNQQPMHGHNISMGQPMPGQITNPTQIRMAVGANNPALPRTRMPVVRGPRQAVRPAVHHGQIRGGAAKGPRMPLKRPGQVIGGTPQKRRTDMLLPGKHDNEDCQVMSMQKQREGLPLIHSVQGAKDKLNLGSQISITKKTVNKEANAMANVLASRGISVKQKQKSRSPSPPRALPNLPNIPGVSIKHSSKSSNFSIPEAKIGGGMLSCKICKKMFMSSTSLSVHMSNAHPQSKLPLFKCDECPASYPKSLQLQHHKRVFHNVTGPDRELGLPVVDLSQVDNLQRLSSLGIYSFIPLANREQGNGCFGIPVISVHNVQNGLTSGLQALGADGLLSLGPLKPLPNS
ncbi:hypothetical protein RR48_11210 [Papilio machaon]|uniref:C2H2-type domain-containing protein n=1 Tax=Papilio machaon TaxID=76193 RepID=A0A194QQM8_PAPMA|nr:hypothetical protein RR48_11210 [Papilio machaon]